MLEHLRPTAGPGKSRDRRFQLPQPAADLVAGFAILWLVSVVAAGPAGALGLDGVPLLKRHTDITREAATKFPRREEDQAVVDGWPLYRTERGQEAFNTAMATLAATNGAPPPAHAFRGCTNLNCHLRLPKIASNGWLPPGRLWLSPDSYMVIVRSPRPGINRRRSPGRMRLFVFHEFRNGTRNTDVYDTISAHRRSVFVPFYISKPSVDAEGRNFVFLIQIAPYDVRSRHAANHGNRGPGVEVAKNYSDPLSPLQSKAGVLLGEMVRAKSPRLRMVHHRQTEGLEMLRAYKSRRRALRRVPARNRITLPFVPLEQSRLASARLELGDLIRRPGLRPTRIARRSETRPSAVARPVSKPPVRSRERTVARAVEAARIEQALSPPKPKLLQPPRDVPKLVAAPRIISEIGGAPFVARQEPPRSMNDLVREVLTQ